MVHNENPNQVVLGLVKEIHDIVLKYDLLIDAKQCELDRVNKALSIAYSTEQKVDLLVEKDNIKSEIEQLKTEGSGEISKVRYLKGLQIIKILYEKVLGLDHHFASVRTLSEINKMSNPNQYPEYEKLKEVVATKKIKNKF